MAPGEAGSAPADGLEQMESPVLDEAAARALAERLYGLTGGLATEMAGYDDKNFWLRPERVTDNPHLGSVAPHGYTLKVTNSLDSRHSDFVEEQNRLLSFLAARGVPCPRPVLNKEGNTFSIQVLRPDGPGHAVRLLEYIPGEVLGKVPWQPDLALQVGREIAKINRLMDGVHLPTIMSRSTDWSLWRAPAVLKYLDLVEEPSRKALVQDVLDAFQREVAAHASFLRQDAGIIHGDFNQFNILVEARDDGRYTLTGIIDLGDCHCAPRLFEVALTATYMALSSGELEAVGSVLEGYAAERPLTAEAVTLLRVCVCARLCQSLVLGLRAHALEPRNTYVLDSQKNGWPLLQSLWQAPAGTFEDQWSRALGVASSKALPD